MFCPRCGAQIQEGAQYCSNCGAPVEAPPVSAVEKAPAAAAARVNPVQATSGMAIAAMVCGIVGFFFGPVLSILAIIFSCVAFPQFRKAPALKGKGMATAGLVLGIIGLAWSVLWIVWVLWGLLFII